MLYDSGLTKEAESMEKETECKVGVTYFGEMMVDTLTDSEVMEIVYKYVTSTEPL